MLPHFTLIQTKLYGKLLRQVDEGRWAFSESRMCPVGIKLNRAIPLMLTLLLYFLGQQV